MPDPLSGLPLASIRVFEAAARHKSFTRAAEELGMTQAAVSWQIKALEGRLGQPLFRRLPREVALTEAGERLARGAVDAMAALRRALEDLVEADQAVLSLTTMQTVATQWLAPRLGGFQLANPGLAVRLDTSPRLVDLAHEPVDLAVRGGAGVWPGVDTMFLLPGVHAPLCTPAFREACGGLARPEDLLQAPRIGLEREWAAWFAVAGLAVEAPRLAPRLAADTQALEVAGALAGQGVALASPIFYAREIAEGRLVRPFQPVAELHGGYWLCWAKDRGRSKKIARFRDWIRAEIEADRSIAEGLAALNRS